MKKIFWMIAAAMVLLAPLAAQTININMPHCDACSWYQESQHLIKWTKTGVMQDVVKIRLRKWGSGESEPSVLSIIDSTANNGSFPWSIPNSVVPGEYFIRVRTLDSKVIGDSCKLTIRSCMKISLNSPNGGENWPVNSMREITWSATCVHGKVQLVLLRNGKYMGIIASGLQVSDGKFAWKVGHIAYRNKPDIAGVGGGYKVRVVKEPNGPFVPTKIQLLGDDSDGEFSIKGVILTH